MLSVAPSASSQIRRSLEQVRYLTLREVVGLHEIDELSNRLICSPSVVSISATHHPACGSIAQTSSHLVLRTWIGGRQGEELLRKEPRPGVGVPIHATAWRSLFGKGRPKLVIEPCRNEIDVLVDAIRAKRGWEVYVAPLHEQMVILDAS